MLAQELIARKRDGAELTDEELRGFLAEYGAGHVPDYQMSAFLMAVLLNDMSAAELATLTRSIIDSGRRLDFRSDGGLPAVDKHSTGGVGDKVSLVLAPLLAEYGLRVPMMSGRGLGHTGGTVDKLESIPGFRTALDLDEFQAVLADVGCAMIRQTPEIAPLDGRLYALRDVTATVPSIPLICASIISKKVAEGIEALVLDVKYGSGAFMRDPDQAVVLAETLVGLAESEGVRATALLTAMEQPLARPWATRWKFERRWRACTGKVQRTCGKLLSLWRKRACWRSNGGPRGRRFARTLLPCWTTAGRWPVLPGWSSDREETRPSCRTRRHSRTHPFE